jgi:hypothetical protein
MTGLEERHQLERTHFVLSGCSEERKKVMVLSILQGSFSLWVRTAKARVDLIIDGEHF